MSRKTRKLIWSVPLVAVFAVAGALAIFMTLAPNQAAAQQQEVAPGMPRNLKATELDQTTIKLTWEKPSPSDDTGLLDGYRIDYSDDNKVWYTRTADVASDATEYVDNEDLKASQMRYYRIFAFNTGGSSRAHDPVSTTTEASMKPDAPTALLVAPGTVVANTGEHRDNEWLVLTWRAPVNPPGAPVEKYRIQVSKDGNSFTDLVSGLSAKKAMCTGIDVDCEYTHKGLLESTERWYRVYATNSVSESVASTRSSGKTNAGNIPAAAGALRVSVTPGGGMALYWDRPPTNTGANVDTAVGSGLNDPTYDPNGAPVLGYYVMGAVTSNLDTLNFDSDDEDEVADTSVSTSEVYYVEANTDLTLTTSVLDRLARFDGKPNPAAGIDPTYWSFRVMAVNKVVQSKVADGTIDPDDGTWSSGIAVNNAPNTANTDVTEQLYGIPKITKTALHATSNQGRTGIELAWTVPVIDGRTANYRVEYSDDLIDWHVLHTQAGGQGTNVFVTPATAAADGTGTNTGTADLTGVHINLTAGTRYHYRVFAYQPNTRGTSNAILSRVSGPSSLTTSTPNRPESPTWNVDPNPLSETELEMTFWLSTDDAAESPATDGTNKAMSGHARAGFGALKGYRIEVSVDGKDWTKYRPIMITLEGEPYSYTYSVKYDEATGIPTLTETRETDPIHEVKLKHTNLHQAAKRYYRVSTKNNAPGSLGYSEPSAIKNTQTFAAQGADDPAWLVAKAQGRDTIQLLWTARADDITAANITGYRIQSSPLNDQGSCAQDWTNLVEDTTDTTGTTTSHTHTGLMPGDGFCYRVFGINVVGESTGFIGFGDSYINTFDNDAIATTDPAMVPGMPTNVMATDTSDTEITVTWEAPADNGGADITGYMVERGVMGADSMMTWTAVDPAHSGMMMEYMDTSLMPMTKYYYRVSATNSVGTGDPSDGMAYAMTDPSNMAPVDGPNLTATVTAGDMTTVQSTITDPDTGDTLTWNTMTSSTAATIATATVNATTGMVTITGVAAGSATITVTAMDAAGESATQMIAVTVEAANAAPMATVDPGDLLPNEVSLVVGGDDEVITLTDSFTDSDGDTLTYTAMSSDDAIATATVSDDGAMLTIAAVSAGMATVTVTASDGNGGTATHDIAVTVAAERMAPSNVVVNPVGSGLVNVEWEPVPGAHGYYIVAAENRSGGSVNSEAINGGDSRLGSIGGLTAGVEYLIYVGAFFTLEEYVLEYQTTITAE